MVGVYSNLGKYLSLRKTNEITLKFSDVEEILSHTLPPSSRKFRTWWANDRQHVQAKTGWLNSGWRTSKVNLVSEIVKFERINGIERKWY